MKERQNGKKAGILTEGRTATYKTGGRDCNREMGADDRLAVKGRQTNKRTDRLIGRQTCGVTEDRQARLQAEIIVGRTAKGKILYVGWT